MPVTEHSFPDYPSLPCIQFSGQAGPSVSGQVSPIPSFISCQFPPGVALFARESTSHDAMPLMCHALLWQIYSSSAVGFLNVRARGKEKGEQGLTFPERIYSLLYAACHTRRKLTTEIKDAETLTPNYI